MKARPLAVAGLILAAVATPLLIQHRAAVNLRLHEEGVRQRAGALAGLLAENDRLSNLLAQAQNSQSLSETQFMELLKLRNTVGQLRGTLKEMEQFRREIDRINDASRQLAKQKESHAGSNNRAALLADEMPQRQERIARLKRWLEERIPELEFLSEAAWVKQVNWEPVTDEEYRGHMGALRANAESKFAQMTYT